MERTILQQIIRRIEAKMPEVATREIGGCRYEGEERFAVEVEDLVIDCVRRLAFIDCTDLDYYNGTGYATETVYDEIAVLGVYDSSTGEENEGLCYRLNKLLA